MKNANHTVNIHIFNHPHQTKHCKTQHVNKTLGCKVLVSWGWFSIRRDVFPRTVTSKGTNIRSTKVQTKDPLVLAMENLSLWHCHCYNGVILGNRFYTEIIQYRVWNSRIFCLIDWLIGIDWQISSYWLQGHASLNICLHLQHQTQPITQMRKLSQHSAFTHTHTSTSLCGRDARESSKHQCSELAESPAPHAVRVLREWCESNGGSWSLKTSAEMLLDPMWFALSNQERQRVSVHHVSGCFCLSMERPRTANDVHDLENDIPV